MDNREMKSKHHGGRIISFRLSEGLSKMLDDIKQHSKQSLSDFMRKAIYNYIIMFYLNPQFGNPQMIFSKNLIFKMFNFLNERQVEEIADLAFQNSLKSIEKYKTLLKKDKFANEKPSSNFMHQIYYFLNTFKETVFSHHAQNWMSYFDFKIQKDTIVILGNHDLGINFSNFLASLLEKHLERYSFILENKKFLSKDTEGKNYNIVLKFKINL